MEDKSIYVRYMFGDSSCGDLVCFITEFMDKYLLNPPMKYCKTYLYNDLEAYSTEHITQIAFRFPGATRGGIILERLDQNRFIIKDFKFNVDVCFEEHPCYAKKLKDDISIFIGSILDFSNVKLKNNRV